MKPGSYRPTTLKLGSKHCPRAMSHYANGQEYDRRIFAVGTVDHAMIQVVTEHTNAGRAVLSTIAWDRITLALGQKMMTEGRHFDGIPEPQVPADAVWAGRDLARSYCERYPIEPAAEGAVVYAELGMAVDSDWNPATYGKDARLRLIADRLTIAEEWDEESSARVLSVRDYKSAWPTSKKELDTIQMKAQAVLAHIHHGAGVDIVRQEVVNLRTGGLFSRDLVLGAGGLETLERWRDELGATMDALDELRAANGVYKASPGGGCIGCPYAPICKEGGRWAERALEHSTPLDRATAYAAMEGQRKALMSIIKEDTCDAPTEIDGGRTVGLGPVTKRVPCPDAALLIFEEWKKSTPDVDSLLIALGIGAKQIDNVARVLFPERGQRDERSQWADELSEYVVESRFGIHKLED